MPRLIRVLVYEGSDEELQRVLARRGVKGSYRYGPLGKEVLIRESIIGDFLEPFDVPHKEDDNAQRP